MKKWLLEFLFKAWPFILKFLKLNSTAILAEIGPFVLSVVEAVEKAHPGEDKFTIVYNTVKLKFPAVAKAIINRAIEIAVGIIIEEGLEVKK